MTSVPRSRSRRRGPIVAGVLVVVAIAAAGTAYAAVSTPPPAYAIFAAPPAEGSDPTNAARSLSDRGTIVVEGPRVLPTAGGDVRIAVYREWLDDDRAEVCAAVEQVGGWLMHTTCTTEWAFRQQGVRGSLDDGQGYRLDYRWMPDGTATSSVTVEGVRTLEQLEALEIPALELLEPARASLEAAMDLGAVPGSLVLGPTRLGEVRGQPISGFVSTRAEAGWLPGDDRLEICLSVGGNGGGWSCALPEEFRDGEGLFMQSGSVTAQWMPWGELIVGDP